MRNGASNVLHPTVGGETVLFRATGIGLAIDRTVILDAVDLSIAPGEIVTLIGPNGAGKTSLLKVVLGLVAPTAGRIERRRGLTFGYLPQRFAVDPTLPLTVRRFLGLPNGAKPGAIREALAKVGVAYAEGRALQALSGGEFQRVMLARCLLRRPDVLVLDEPMQGVDVGGQVALFELITHLRDAHGFAVLMVSHDLHLVMGATDRVVCLNGHVCCSGQPEQVSTSAGYRSLFGDRAAQALAVYAHSHDHDHDPVSGSEDRASVAGANVGHRDPAEATRA